MYSIIFLCAALVTELVGINSSKTLSKCLHTSQELRAIFPSHSILSTVSLNLCLTLLPHGLPQCHFWKTTGKPQVQPCLTAFPKLCSSSDLKEQYQYKSSPHFYEVEEMQVKCIELTSQEACKACWVCDSPFLILTLALSDWIVFAFL